MAGALITGGVRQILRIVLLLLIARALGAPLGKFALALLAVWAVLFAGIVYVCPPFAG
jgi:hypothetical protein